MTAGWWWLSFCDPSRPTGQHSLGVAIVGAASFPEAVMVAHATGCNPGGEVMGHPVREDMGAPPAEWDHKLVSSLAEIERLESLWIGEPASITTIGELEDERSTT
jgi:hypothetical protein